MYALFGLIIALGLPLLELLGIIGIWQLIGPWTLLWLLLAALAGVSLIVQERLTFLPRLAHSLLSGQDPFAVLKAGGLRFVAGLLLALPGALSDAVAVLLLLVSLTGATRRKPGRAANADTFAQPAADEAPVRPHREGDVIDGEFRRLDD